MPSPGWHIAGLNGGGVLLFWQHAEEPGTGQPLSVQNAAGIPGILHQRLKMYSIINKKFPYA